MVLPTEPYKKIAVILFYIAVAIAGTYLFFKYVFAVVLPFLIAYALAMMLQPAVRFLVKHAKVPRKLSVLVLVLVVTTLLGVLCYFTIERIVAELSALIQSITQFISKLRNDEQAANDLIAKINGMIPFVDMTDRLTDLWMNMDAELENLLVNLVGPLSNSVLPILSGALTMVPKVLLVLVVVVLSTYYFTDDFDKINKFLLAQLPQKTASNLRLFKEEFMGTISKFVRAYGLIMLITFFQLFAAFLLLDVKYAFLIALFTSIVDLLPVLGTGTVLLPWAAFHFLTGNYYMGGGLLIVYGVVLVVRNIIEPKIVGKYLGLYPLLTLIAMYVGLETMGILGLLLFPVGTIILQKLNRDGKIKLYVIPEGLEPPPPKEKRAFFRRKK